MVERPVGEPSTQVAADPPAQAEGKPSAPAANKAHPDRRLTLLRVLTLVLFVVIMAVIFMMRDHLQDLAHLGYFGIFLTAMIANATVFLPVPGIAMVFAMGAVFDPFLVAISAGLGAATGELTGYLLGFSGQGLVERVGWYQRIRNWMTTHPKLIDLGVLALAAIPNPFFDAAGIAAGTLKIPVLRFFIFCAIGSTLKMLLFAFGGNTILNQIFPSP